MTKRWIIPDIHGCSRTLKYLLENQLKITKNDPVYFLGDYIDRGPDGKGVLDYLMNLEKEEYEADDILGTLASYGEKNDMNVFIVLFIAVCLIALNVGFSL